MDKHLTFRRFRDGDSRYRSWTEQIFEQDASPKCPTYVHRTPPCQGSCPAGEDIRGWLDIVRGVERPPEGLSWQEYAFRRAADANPFPAIMGRVCPAPCEDGCNRNEVEEAVGINSVEQYIGDAALAGGFALPAPGPATGRRVAIIGAGPAGLAAAWQLRRRGHAVTVFDAHPEPGGMMRYGIPGYRTPRAVLDGEVQRILDLGVELVMNTRVGRDVSREELARDFDAVLVAVGAQAGRPLPVPGADAPNCITGVAFLEAFNDGRLQAGAGRVLVIGGGDTAMDVVSVARRLGHIRNVPDKDRVENIVLGQTAQDVALAARREGAEVTLLYRRPVDRMPAARHEVEAAEQEGVRLIGSRVPLEVMLDDAGRARALRVAAVEWDGGEMHMIPGSEEELPCELIVSAIGQTGELTGLEALDNGRGLIDADAVYAIPGQPGWFVAGDVVRPHLLTTAIGQASVAAESIDRFLQGAQPGRRPKVDVHHFDLLNKLREFDRPPAAYAHEADWGTAEAAYAVHNYEDRARQEIIPSSALFLGHFTYTPRHRRRERAVDAAAVLGHFEERIVALDEAEARAEADRCMSCGMCFECDNCVIYCPQDAVHRTPPAEAVTGRYVYTDYTRCIGCHICAEVCPTGYISMGLGG